MILGQRPSSSVPRRCTFCAEWVAGEPAHCPKCGEAFQAAPLAGLARVVRSELRKRAN